MAQPNYTNNPNMGRSMEYLSKVQVRGPAEPGRP